MSVSDDLFEPGHAVGSYRMLLELGHRGIGHVPLAEDISAGGRHVALKVASGSSSNADEVHAPSFALLFRDQRRRAEARELLVLVFGTFTEGVDTADSIAAKALFEELAR